MPKEVFIGYRSNAELNGGVHQNVAHLEVVFGVLSLQVEMVIC